MARQLDWSDVESGKPFRLEIKQWGWKPNGDIIFVGGRGIFPFDSLSEENLAVRGLFWELARASTSSEGKSWITSKFEETITLDDLCWFLRLTKEEVEPALRRLYEIGRVDFWAEEEEDEK